MSGGGIGAQTGDDDRQIVVFTFSGKLDAKEAAEWNTKIGELLMTFGDRVTGVTLKDVGGRNPKRKP
jgi:hypothetical protein